MVAQVLLEVQDRQRITLLQRQQLAERRIGLDRLLVHQVVLARIRHNALRHRRPADLRVLRLAEERAQLRADPHRLREDAGLRLSALDGLRLALAAALGLLNHARGLLLNDLQRRRRRAERRLQRRQLLVEIRDRLLERGTNILLRRLERRRCRGGSNRRGRDRRNHLLGLDRLRLGRLLLGHSNGRGQGGNGLNNGLHSGSLLGGGLRGRAHGFGVVEGSIRRHGTRYTCRVSGAAPRQVWLLNRKSCRPGLGRPPTFVLK